MTRRHATKQIRYTLEDSLSSQQRLRSLVQQLIAENRPLRVDEKDDFFELMAKSLFSQGTSDSMTMIIDDGWYIFGSCQNFALRLAELTSNHIELTTDKPHEDMVQLPISELWHFFYDKLLYLFPRANAEAVHMSAESVHLPPQGHFEFRANARLEDGGP